MKKALFLLPALALLASCGNPSSSSLPSEASQKSEAPYSLDLKVACPAGAPAVAFYRHVQSANLEVNADPANVAAYLTGNSDKDVVVLPTNAGLTAITKKNAPFQIAATITFGNFYLASTGNDDNETLDDDDYVVCFQQGNVPDKLLQYSYPTLTNIHYVTAASDAAQVLISGTNISDNNAKADYVLMAEPALTANISKNEKAKEYSSIQEVFKQRSGNKEITQASIFVRNSLEKNKVDAFLNDISSSVSSFLATPTVLDSYLEGMDENAVKAKFSSPAAMIKNMAAKNNRMGLGYKGAYENRAAVENFSALFGIADIHEEVYYK